MNIRFIAAIEGNALNQKFKGLSFGISYNVVHDNVEQILLLYIMDVMAGYFWPGSAA